MPTATPTEQHRKPVQLLIEQLGTNTGNAVLQIADETAYGRTRLMWHRQLFINGMKEKAFQNLPPAVIREIEMDWWGSMVMCISRLTNRDTDESVTITIQMLPRLIREDEKLHRRLSRGGTTQDQHHCCVAALVSGRGP